MNVHDLQVAFARIGCDVNVVKTGHPDYLRGFIIGPDGVTYGRATIYERRFQHIKWYGGGMINLTNKPRDRWDQSDFIFWSFEVLMVSGHVLSRAEWLCAWQRACKLAREDLASKRQWRRENPKLDAKGQPQGRRKLEGRNPRAYLHQILLHCQN